MTSLIKFHWLSTSTLVSKYFEYEIAFSYTMLLHKMLLRLIHCFIFDITGMPAMVTKRLKELEKAKTISNGTIGFIVGFICANGHTYYGDTPLDIELFHQKDYGSHIIWKFRDVPSLLLFKVRNCDRQLVSGYPVGVIGIPAFQGSIPIRLAAKKLPAPSTFNTATSATSAPNKNKNKAALSISIKQFAIIPTLAMTPEKLQGVTLNHYLYVSNLIRHGYSPQTLYVTLSRVRDLKWLVLLERIDLDYLKKFAPPLPIIQQMKALLHKIVLPSYMHKYPEEATKQKSWLQLQLSYIDQATITAESLLRKKKDRRKQYFRTITTPRNTIESEYNVDNDNYDDFDPCGVYPYDDAYDVDADSLDYDKGYEDHSNINDDTHSEYDSYETYAFDYNYDMYDYDDSNDYDDDDDDDDWDYDKGYDDDDDDDNANYDITHFDNDFI